MGSFTHWQAEYEAARLPVFPVDADEKRPLVGNYLRAGLAASRAWAGKFPQANALGIACGRRNRLTVLDIDAADENLLADALAHFGKSPVVVRTASGKFHAWYRWNGEGRMIRTAMPGQPIDICGAGYIIAPPSLSARGQYQFIEGSLADLQSLPALKLAKSPLAAANDPAPPVVPVGERNVSLFRALMQAATTCEAVENLMTFASQLNASGFQAPLPEEEVVRLVGNVWSKTQAGENWFGSGRRLVLAFDDLDDLLPLGADAVSLMLKLRREHWGRETFCVANAMAAVMPGGPWTIKRFAAARRCLVQAGRLIEVRRASLRNGAAVFRFAKFARAGEGGEQGGRV